MNEPINQAELVEDVFRADLADPQVAAGPVPTQWSAVGFWIVWIAFTVLVWFVEHRSTEFFTPFAVLQFSVGSGNRQLYGMISRLVLAPAFAYSIAFSFWHLWQLYARNQIGASSGCWAVYEFAAWTLGRLVAGGLTWIAMWKIDESDLLVLVPILASGLISGCALFSGQHSPRWRWYFWASVLRAILFALWGVTREFPEGLAEKMFLLGLLVWLASAILSCAKLVTYLICLIGDLRDRRHVDRQHWTNAILVAFYWAVVIVDLVSLTFAPY